MDILKSPHVDKVRFLYSFLDPVRLFPLLTSHLYLVHSQLILSFAFY